MKSIQDLFKEIDEYNPSCEQERTDKRIILDIIEKHKSDVLYRDCEAFHITSSGFTINKNRSKFLMVYHNIYDSWSWIGGHADGEADLLEVACKEVKEETGVIHLEPDKKDIISIDILTTSAHYKKGVYVPNHLHLNISYLIIADETDPLHIKADENSDVRWIPVSEMEHMVSEQEMIKVYNKILMKLRMEDGRKNEEYSYN